VVDVRLAMKEVPFEVRDRAWSLRGEGYPVVVAATMVGLSRQALFMWVTACGGVRPRPPRPRSPLRLSLAEREEISRGLAAGLSLAVIGRRIGRPTCTVSREVTRNSSAHGYRAHTADRAALVRARRPKPAKLAVNAELRAVVQDWLELEWSPQQIAARLAVEFPDRPEMRVSHETIYTSLFVQSRGALRKELHQRLRTGQAIRRPPRRIGERRGQIKDMVMISDRPAEADDRAVPGHWEGDLVLGKNGKSAIGTLVERSTRFVMLLHLADGFTPEQVRDAMTAKIRTLPTQLRRSITWDQGREMHQHAQFTIDTGVQIYFCNPHSPWQRGSNENTNGLLRQYFPKSTDLTVHNADHLDAIAARLNGRPRQTLDWKTPSEAFNELVAMTT
jgi:IS30 family transposase